MTSTLQKTYKYKMFRNDVFLGELSDVKSEFRVTEELFSAYSQIEVTIGRTPDTADQRTEALQTEQGEDITDEFGSPIMLDRQPDIVGDETENALIRNWNDIEVWEFSTWHPSGIKVFSGFVTTWDAGYANDGEVVFTAVSDGQDLNNFFVQPSEASGQSQTTKDFRFSVFKYPGYDGGSWRMVYQSFIPGAGIDNVSAVDLWIGVATPSAAGDVYVEIFDNEGTVISGGGVSLGYAAKYVDSSSAGALHRFNFSSPIPVVEGNTYFMRIRSNSLIEFDIFGTSPSAYANGEAKFTTDGVSSSAGGDLYFVFYQSAGETLASFTAQDISDVQRDIISNYGGSLTYTATSVDDTGVLIDHSFLSDTALEAIKQMQEIVPANWYWYVNIATGVFYSKAASATAEHTFIKAKHLEDARIKASVLEVKNDAYFTGGIIDAFNTNLFVHRTDDAAIAAANNHIGLARIFNNRIIDQDVAEEIVLNYLEANGAQKYETKIAINDVTYDTSTISLGQVVGFSNFGSFVDRLLLIVVQIERRPDGVKLGLGTIPKRQSQTVEALERNVIDILTVDNPDTPS